MRTNTRKHHVVSTNLDLVGYSRKYQILDIQFQNGGSYRYFNVPRKVYEALMRADSKGEYYNDNIKGNTDYAPMKLTDANPNPSKIFTKTEPYYLKGPYRYLVINEHGTVVRVSSTQEWVIKDAEGWATNNPGVTYYALQVLGEAVVKSTYSDRK